MYLLRVRIFNDYEILLFLYNFKRTNEDSSSQTAIRKRLPHLCPQKVKASFRPSRYWGPRDPITHYYWQARRDEIQRGEAPPVEARWKLGELSRWATGSLATCDSQSLPSEAKVIDKLRSKSDDICWTVNRRDEFRKQHQNKRRSRSLDWRQIFSQQIIQSQTLVLSPFDIHTTSVQEQQEEIENVMNAKVSSLEKDQL